MNSIEKELYHVEKMIKADVVKEKSIKEIYKYIFKSDGKKIRARLNLISSSINRKKNNWIGEINEIIIFNITIIFDIMFVYAWTSE